MPQIKAKLGKLSRFDSSHITRNELTLVLATVQRCIAVAATATVPPGTAAQLLAQSDHVLMELAADAPGYLTQGQLAALLQSYLEALIRASAALRLPASERQQFFGAAAQGVAALLRQVVQVP